MPAAPLREMILDPLAFTGLIAVAHAGKLRCPCFHVNVSGIAPHPSLAQFQGRRLDAHPEIPAIEHAHQAIDPVVLTARGRARPGIGIDQRIPECHALPRLRGSCVHQPFERKPLPPGSFDLACLGLRNRILECAQRSLADILTGGLGGVDSHGRAIEHKANIMRNVHGQQRNDLSVARGPTRNPSSRTRRARLSCRGCAPRKMTWRAARFCRIGWCHERGNQRTGVARS